MTVFRVFLIAAALLLLAMLVIALLALAETRQRVAALEAERSTADTRHGPIEYVSWGEGPPVLVVHGAGGGFDQGRILARAIGGTLAASASSPCRAACPPPFSLPPCIPNGPTA